MRKRARTRSKPEVTDLARFMSGLHADQKRLTEIQSAYDNLTLLGQLLCAGTDITRMRQDFNDLAAVLLEQLAQEHYKKAVLNLGSCARVAIDILTRNLFERTADIGFLATDHEICTFAEAVEADPALRHDPQWQYTLQSRFTEYVRKYSVYHNIILLSPTGEVLVQLDGNNPVSHSSDRLIGEALTSSEPYVEIFRPTDLVPGDESPLVYAYRVMSADGSHPVGILCLCFRFHDECERIFESLVAEDDWTVITLLDNSGRVIASSDPNQFPVGVTLERLPDEECRVVRFAGREYLATTRPTHGYQGYSVPGWVGHALAPLNHAFELSETNELDQVPEDFLKCVLETTNLFSPALREIPRKAASIQNELNRAVWNGNLWLVRDRGATQSAFAKVLLREIGSTGVRTRNIFSESTTNLYKTVLSSVLFDCGTQAALAIDIMDRNLYERANDCRWWALNRVFREELCRPDVQDKAQRQRLTEVLRRINGLYTVYSNLILFDAHGRVMAVSNPAYNDCLGRTLGESWVRGTLGLPDTQTYCVSSFAPTGLYADQPTYVFSAAVREPNSNEPIGGIAIVFDSTPQFQAMLMDALPRQADGDVIPGAFAVFAERDGRVLASTHPELVAGTPLMIGYEFFNLQHGESCSNVVIYDGRYYAVGSSMSAGYREYKAPGDSHRNDVVALVFSPLSECVVDPAKVYSLRDAAIDTYAIRHAPVPDSIDIACFYIGRNWYGLRTLNVVEALDAERITPMPGLPDAVSGCLMYDDQAISVFDLTAALSPKAPPEERRQPRPGSKRQVLILQSATHQVRFGILVDQLGAVVEIPNARVEPVPGMMADGQSLIESLVKPTTDDSERRILIVLSVERILQRIGGGLPASVDYSALGMSTAKGDRA